MVPGSILSGGYVSCLFSTPFMTIYAILNDFVYTTFNNFNESIFRITKDQRKKMWSSAFRLGQIYITPSHFMLGIL